MHPQKRGGKAMSVKIISPGLLTTVQDCGRFGYQASGFSVSGVLDFRSYKLANLLAGNAENLAVLEVTMVGITAQFTENTTFAITGGDFSPTLNGEPIKMYQTIFANDGDELKMSLAKTGSRGYIAFLGGVDVSIVMGSRSTNLKCGVGGFEGRALRAGDVIEIGNNVVNDYRKKFKTFPADDFSANSVQIRAVSGPQDDYFTQKGKKTFFSEAYTITQAADRMGFKLDGTPIENINGVDIVSDGIALGSVQVPSNGKPIVMLADRQTTGGYAKIATVISSDIPKLVQLKPGDKVYFKEITVKEAELIHKKEQKEFEKLMFFFS